MSRESFKKAIDLINDKYDIIDSSKIRNLDLSYGQSNFAVLTFDDGLRDHYWAHQHLKKLNLLGSFFIPKMPVVKLKVMNTHKIQFILASCSEKKVVKEIFTFFDNKETTKLWDDYSKTLWKNNWWSKEMIFVTNFLRKHTESKNITDYLFDKYVKIEEENFSRDLYLNEKQIEEMANNGMVIGGHGNFSENMKLMNIDTWKSELKESSNFISKWSDNLSMSYPNGGYNDEIVKFAKSVGFNLAFTTNKKTLTFIDDFNYLEIPRYDGAQDVIL